MAEASKNSFEWQEVCDLFCIHDEEVMECERNEILERINKMTERLGREYVIRKIALSPTH